jgi:phosphoribosylformylglycinamidine cyclo-ligase
LANSITYKDAGVDLQAAQDVVGDIAALRQRTEGRRRMLDVFGGFAGAFDLSDYREPVLVTGCDGIGTKLIPLLAHDALETAGIDLVAMSVNDILTTGAQPLLFLDYIGVGRIDRAQIRRLIGGMAEALAACDCILAGGETAEMPDLVGEGQLELSGFCVGALEKSAQLDPAAVQVGDVVFGLPSNGFHANGWSLIRQAVAGLELDAATWAALLAPTRIYYREVRQLQEAGVPIRAMAHITGGGLAENFARVLGGKGAALEIPAWREAAVQPVLERVALPEALRAFNMGWGWLTVVPPDAQAEVERLLPEARRLGAICEGAVTVQVAS